MGKADFLVKDSFESINSYPTEIKCPQLEINSLQFEDYMSNPLNIMALNACFGKVRIVKNLLCRFQKQKIWDVHYIAIGDRRLAI